MRRRGNRFRSDRDRDLHDFDLGFRTRRLNRQRSRARLRWLFRLGLVAMVLATVGLSLRWIYQQVFYEDTEFRVERLLVESDGNMTETEVSAITGVGLGSPLMNIDLVEVCERLEAVPSVRTAKVERELPGTLRFSILENQPLAWLSCPPHGVRPHVEGSYLLAAGGLLMQCARPHQSHRALPVIEVFQMPMPANGSVVPGEGIQAALRLLQRHEALFSGVPDLEPHLIRLKTPFSISCRYASNMEVTYGMKEIDRSLNDLKLILEVARSEGKKLATVNLLASRNIPVTYFENAESPARVAPMLRAVPAGSPDPSAAVPATPSVQKLSSILNRD